MTEITVPIPFQLEGTPGMQNGDQFDEWMTSARARLAARRTARPSTKAGAVRALWPEIHQALQSGQTLKTIRDWLEAEGISMRYNQFTTYVRRIRRTRIADTPSQAAARITVQAGRHPPAPESGAMNARDPLANLRLRQGKHRTFDYNPEFKEEDLL